LTQELDTAVLRTRAGSTREGNNIVEACANLRVPLTLTFSVCFTALWVSAYM